MQQLLMHHVGRTDLTGIANCHVRGLHSIMLHDQDGNRIRLYCTTDEIDTHSNYMSSDNYLMEEYDLDEDDIESLESHRAESNQYMNLGLHGHSTDVRLEVLSGALYNITAEVEMHDDGGMTRWNYSSRITGDGSITRAAGETWRAKNIESTRMIQGENVYMEANKLHTVYVDGAACWLVYERGERHTNDSFFSYNPHADQCTTGSDMYRTMTSEECQAMLARVIASYQAGQERAANAAFNARAKQKRVEALAVCKSAVAMARAATPQALREGNAGAILRMVPATGCDGAGRTVLILLTNHEWSAWLDHVEHMRDDAGIKDSYFLSWALARISERTPAPSDVPVSEPVRRATRRTSVTTPGLTEAQMDMMTRVMQTTARQVPRSPFITTTYPAQH